MLVKLRVNETTFNDIMERIVMAGQLDRVNVANGEPGGLAIDLSEVAIVIDPAKMIAGEDRSGPKFGEKKRGWNAPGAGWRKTKGHTYDTLPEWTYFGDDHG